MMKEKFAKNDLGLVGLYLALNRFQNVRKPEILKY